MKRIAWGVAACMTVCISACAGTDEQASSMSADEIIAKNVAARGGAEAWHKIDSMLWIGRVENHAMPARFVLAMKRPNKTRFEIVSMNRMALRVFDGTQGWKLRPMSRDEEANIQPYNAQELRFARDEQLIDGPLIDHAQKGIDVKLGGIDEVEGKKAYRLELRMPSGDSRRVWVDASSFLDVKAEHQTRTPLGQTVAVDVYYHDFRTFEGVKIPCEIESGAATGSPIDKLTIEKIQINAKVDDSLFARPLVASERSHRIQVAPSGAAPALSGSAPRK